MFRWVWPVLAARAGCSGVSGVGGREGSRSLSVRPSRVSAASSGVVASLGVWYAVLAGLVEPGEAVRDPRVKDDEGVDGSEDRWKESSSEKESRLVRSGKCGP